MVEDLVLVGIDGKKGCQEGEEGIEGDERQPVDRHSVLLESSPRIHPEAHAFDGLIELVQGVLIG